MKQLNCIVVDDSELDRLSLSQEISKISELNLLDTFDNCLDAQKRLPQLCIDIVFVDVEMPDISGLDLVRAHRNDDILFVVVSSYPDFALQGFSLHVFDYILKPITTLRLSECVDRIQKYIELKDKASAYDVIFEEDKFIFKEGHTRIRLHYSEVLYLEAYGDYTKIVTENKTYLTLETLGNLLNSLPTSRFIRVHRSYVVAVPKIKRMDLRTLDIGNETIPIGKTFYKSVKSVYY